MCFQITSLCGVSIFVFPLFLRELSYNLTGVGHNASCVLHTGIAHLSQNARGLPAAASGLAVYEYRGIFSGNQTADTAQRLKGNIDASGNMSLLIFLGDYYDVAEPPVW